jgi:hypothetical protein
MFRRFMSENPGDKCDVVVLDSSVPANSIAHDKTMQLVSSLHSHTFRLFSGRPNVVVADAGWKDALSANNKNGQEVFRLLPSINDAAGSPPNNVVVGRFLHGMPYPDKKVAEVLEKGTWATVDLSDHDEVSRALLQRAHTLSVHVEGNSFELRAERQLYKAIARLPRISTICEIGLNAGHSAAMWLIANPTAKVVMFDLFEHKYSKAVEEFLRTDAMKYGLVNTDARLTTVMGSSLDMVPKFARENPGFKCDLLSVDGGHFSGIPQQDLQNMRLLANKDFHILVIDDTNCDGSGCSDPDGAVSQMLAAGHISVVGRLSERFDDTLQEWRRGVTVLQYTPQYLREA